MRVRVNYAPNSLHRSKLIKVKVEKLWLTFESVSHELEKCFLSNGFSLPKLLDRDRCRCHENHYTTKWNICSTVCASEFYFVHLFIVLKQIERLKRTRFIRVEGKAISRGRFKWNIRIHFDFFLNLFIAKTPSQLFNATITRLGHNSSKSETCRC